MIYSNVSHIVLYRAYRDPRGSELQVAMFYDVREAMSFEGCHRRYCSTMDLCKVDFELTDVILKQITSNQSM